VPGHIFLPFYLLPIDPQPKGDHLMRSLVLLAAMLLLPLNAQAQPVIVPTPLPAMPVGVYELDKSHASLIWKVSHLGLSNYAARFTDFDAKLTLDPKDPTKSSVAVTVNPASVKTDYPNAVEKDFDKVLAEGAEWFNTSKFPKIEFVSTALERTGEKTGRMTGNLTFLGVTKPVVLEVTFNNAMAKMPFSGKPTVGFSASGSIKRSEWGMATYIPTIGDEVQLLIEAEFTGTMTVPEGKNQ
jgi:polyisoprenoid-binding protein YceI